MFVFSDDVVAQVETLRSHIEQTISNGILIKDFNKHVLPDGWRLLPKAYETAAC